MNDNDVNNENNFYPNDKTIREFILGVARDNSRSRIPQDASTMNPINLSLAAVDERDESDQSHGPTNPLKRKANSISVFGF